MEVIIHSNFKGELDAEAEILIDKVVNIKKEIYTINKLLEYNAKLKRESVDLLYKKHGISLRKKDINEIIVSDLSEEALCLYNKINEFNNINKDNLKNQENLIKRRVKLNRILWLKYRVVVKFKAN